MGSSIKLHFCSKANRLHRYMRCIIPAAILLLSGACSLRYFVPAAGVQAENRFAIVKTDSLLIAIRPQNYVGNYQQLNSRFFSVFIRVKNNATLKQKLEPASFSILANERQYDYIPLDYLLADLRQASLVSSYENPFAISETQNVIETDNKQQELYYELIANSFSFAEILPGAIKEGYLFYNNKINATDSFFIDVLGNKTGFIKGK